MAEESIVTDGVQVTHVPVEANAIIGRRLTDADYIRDGENIRYVVKAFYDSRVNEDLSVDYLGVVGNDRVVKKMVTTLTPIAQKDFAKVSDKLMFAGWAGLKRKTIARHGVIRTPIEQGDNPNPHHCDIVRDNHRNRTAAMSLAYELVALAENEKLFFSAATTAGSPGGKSPPIVGADSDAPEYEIDEKRVAAPADLISWQDRVSRNGFTGRNVMIGVCVALVTLLLYWWASQS